MIKKWEKQLEKLSGNLTTNDYMPAKLREIILRENDIFKNNISFKKMNFPKLSGILGKIEGLDILAGLQKIQRKDCLTLYRAVRFPTERRLYEMMLDYGCAIANYEQERILELYESKEYLSKRKKIQQDKNFWIVPQERVVHGLPMFSLVNDALQIHYSFRGEKDKVAIIAIHIPHNLLKSKIKLISNSAIDIDYRECSRDFEIKDFIRKESGIIDFDYKSLRARGIDLHEIYAQNLPWCLSDCKKIGIEQEFFILDIFEIKNNIKKNIKKLFNDTELLKKNKFFLHGFFGDQNIFARRESRYLPSKCQRINIK